MDKQDILVILIKLLILCTAFPIHEFAHAWSANKMGDPTAKNMNRMNINPINHIDPIGAICMLLADFGWAKPVPINPNNFKNPKLGMALSSFAGPASNLIMAYIAMIVFKILLFAGVGNVYVIWIFKYMVSLNIGLAIFNLIPIPPLDGSRIATLFLPEKTYFKIMQYEQFIFIGLLLVINLVPQFSEAISFVGGKVFDVMDVLTRYVDWIFG